ncbi:MAG: hypothetical protein H0X12_11015 [Nocardioides sp.]|nr:hypothetical protein [Nocardioides sp.]
MSLRAPLLLVALVLAVLVPLPAGAADRSPTPTELRAIRITALEVCRAAAPEACEFRRARISTPNARFVWAEVVGEGFSGALLKRKTAESPRFRVAGTQGGGIASCSYWLEVAPARVLRDLKISGLVEATGEVRNCGRT